MGDTVSAIENLELFSQQTNYPYLVIPFLRMDPLVDNISDLPEFNRILDDMEVRFWRRHDQIRNTLEGENLI